MRRVIALALIALWITAGVSAEQAGRYRSIAVMDLLFEGLGEGEMHSVVDALSLEILKTQGIRTVVRREQRERLIEGEQAGGSRRMHGSRRYEKVQLANAALLKVDLAVLGEILKTREAYSLGIRLFDVAAGRVLYGEQVEYGSDEQLRQDLERIAVSLVRASGQPPVAEDEKQPPLKREPKLGAAAGFRLGQEGVTAAPGIEGGGALYAEVLTELNHIVGLSVKYAVVVFPSYSASHLITLLPRLNLRLAEGVYLGISAAYTISTDYRSRPQHYLGFRLCPIYSGNIDGLSIEILPFSVLCGLRDGQTVFSMELISLGFWLSGE